MDKKEIVIAISVGLLIMIGSGVIGYFAGFWLASGVYYEDGVYAGIQYTNCVNENTPSFSNEIPQSVLDDCWEQQVNRTPS